MTRNVPLLIPRVAFRVWGNAKPCVGGKRENREGVLCDDQEGKFIFTKFHLILSY